MKVLARSLAALLSLFIFIACTSARTPAQTPASTEPAVVTPASIAQPTKGATPTITAVTQLTVIDSGHLSPVLNMNAGRAAHTATLLPDGKVLVAGGFRQEGTSEIPIASAETYDPQTNTFNQIGNMNEARSGHTATLLPNGLVLIAGGWGQDGRTSTTELYDPKTGNFRYAANMASPRASMTSTLLKNGQVLIAGGDSARNTPQLIAEIYDPATNTFTQSGSLNNGRSAHTATLLLDGNVLLIGGRPSYDSAQVLASAGIYDPTTRKFTYTGDMNMVRYKHAAVLLPDGNVLVVGGSDQDDWDGKYNSAEIYDANTGRFTQIADMNSERFKLADAAVPLGNGDVLIGGGSRQIEIFDFRNQRFISSVKIDDDYYFSVLTLLRDGRVLITGGYDSRIRPSEKAWIFSYDRF
jgi:WD40 repeat protein